MPQNVDITKSCDQNWGRMKVVDHCKFCAVCEKNVIDLTSSTNTEILKTLKQGNGICGRIKVSQIQELNSPNSNKRILSPKWIVTLGLGSLLGISEPAVAQTSKPQVEIRQNTLKAQKQVQTKDDDIEIKGTVKDETGLPLPGVNIILKGTNTGTQSDFDGNFLLKIPKKMPVNERVLEIGYVGFKTQTISIKDTSKALDIKMHPDPTNENEVIVLGGISFHRNIFQRVGDFFARLFNGKSRH